MTQAAATQVQFIVSPRFRGPALIRSMHFVNTDNSSAGQTTGVIPLLAQDGDGAGTYLIGAPHPSGVPLVSSSGALNAGKGSNEYPQGWWFSFNGGTPLAHDLHLNYLTELNEFWLKVGLTSSGTFAVSCALSVMLYEAVDVQSIVDLMAGL